MAQRIKLKVASGTNLGVQQAAMLQLPLKSPYNFSQSNFSGRKAKPIGIYFPNLLENTHYNSDESCQNIS